MALDNQGQVWAWGSNTHGQLGQHGTASPEGGARAVAGGTEAPAGMPSATAAAAGVGSHLGESGLLQLLPVHVPLPGPATSIACGSEHCVAVVQLGDLKGCGWGQAPVQPGQGQQPNQQHQQEQQEQQQQQERQHEQGCQWHQQYSQMVMTWGWGEHGQLGHGCIDNLHHPRPVHLPTWPAAPAAHHVHGHHHHLRQPGQGLSGSSTATGASPADSAHVACASPAVAATTATQLAGGSTASSTPAPSSAMHVMGSATCAPAGPGPAPDQGIITKEAHTQHQHPQQNQQQDMQEQRQELEQEHFQVHVACGSGFTFAWRCSVSATR